MGCGGRRRKKWCPYCKGFHYKKRAYLCCKRRHVKEKWPK